MLFQLKDTGSEANKAQSELGGTSAEHRLEELSANKLDSMSHQEHLQNSKSRNNEVMEFSHGAYEQNLDEDDEDPLEMTFSNDLVTLEPMRTNILNSKLVCYVSSFQVLTAEWFAAYENIQIFKTSLAKIAAKADLIEQFSKVVGLPPEDAFMMLFAIYLNNNFQASSA